MIYIIMINDMMMIIIYIYDDDIKNYLTIIHHTYSVSE